MQPPSTAAAIAAVTTTAGAIAAATVCLAAAAIADAASRHFQPPARNLLFRPLHHHAYGCGRLHAAGRRQLLLPLLLSCCRWPYHTQYGAVAPRANSMSTAPNHFVCVVKYLSVVNLCVLSV